MNKQNQNSCVCWPAALNVLKPSGSGLHLSGAAGLPRVSRASLPLSLGLLVPHRRQVRPTQVTWCLPGEAPSSHKQTNKQTDKGLLAPLLGLLLACGWSLRVGAGDSRLILLFLRKSEGERRPQIRAL